MPAVSVRLPGFGSVAVCAHTDDTPAHHAAATRAHTRTTRPVRTFSSEPPGWKTTAALVGESDPDRTDDLILVTTIEGLRGGAEALVFYAAMDVPGTVVRGA